MSNSTKVTVVFSVAAFAAVVYFAFRSADQGRCTTLSAGPISSSSNCPV